MPIIARRDWIEPSRTVSSGRFAFVGELQVADLWRHRAYEA